MAVNERVLCVNGFVLECRSVEGREKKNVIPSFMVLSALMIVISLGSAPASIAPYKKLRDGVLVLCTHLARVQCAP